MQEMRMPARGAPASHPERLTTQLGAAPRQARYGLHTAPMNGPHATLAALQKRAQLARCVFGNVYISLTQPAAAVSTATRWLVTSACSSRMRVLSAAHPAAASHLSEGRRGTQRCGRCLAQPPAKSYFSEVEPGEGLKPLWGERSKEVRDLQTYQPCAGSLTRVLLLCGTCRHSRRRARCCGECLEAPAPLLPRLSSPYLRAGTWTGRPP
jgi:hypothetical protein